MACGSEDFTDDSEDDWQRLLEEKRARLPAEVVEFELELSWACGAIAGVPHYSVIEARAHELGRDPSRQVQQRQMRETTAATPRKARCPRCSLICELIGHKREAASIDGPVQARELKGHCPIWRSSSATAAASAPASRDMDPGCIWPATAGMKPRTPA